MSDKKNNEKFNNPFSSLKGLSVSGQQKPEKKPEPVAVKPQEPDPVEPPVQEEDVDFFSEMDGLGVRKIERSGLEKSVPRRDDETTDAVESAQPKPGSSSGGGGVARARREKRLRRGDVQPQAELDLHGEFAEGLEVKIGWFLENAVFHQFEAVRIITGKGSHSVDGPVIRPLVEKYLDGPGRKWVIEWMRAPQRQGGAGAIVAFLRV